MINRHELGVEGEKIARNYLIRDGHTIIEQNYQKGRAEIDIISKLGDLLVFTEVKTRSDTLYGYPEEFVSYHQKQLIISAAEQYTYEHHYNECIRFDIIAILYYPQKYSLQHFEDAFY